MASVEKIACKRLQLWGLYRELEGKRQQYESRISAADDSQKAELQRQLSAYEASALQKIAPLEAFLAKYPQIPNQTRGYA